MFRAAIFLCATVLLSACASGPGHLSRVDTARTIAKAGKLAPVSYPTGTFTLAGFVRNPEASQPLVVYVEGDGFAWVSRTQPSVDPTPRDPLGLKLAAVDGSANVLYLARPCQYVGADSPGCDTSMWTNRRFAEEAIAATNRAIDMAVRPGQKIHLVGYSGGGAVAALVAARRNDVVTLRTVAGNLDHAALSRLHGVSPMTGSLNAADVAAALSNLPQLHLVGGRDKVVPAQIAQSYATRQGASRCTRVVSVDGADHEEGWVDAWRQWLSQPVSCAAAVR